MTFVIPSSLVNCRMILDTGISFKEVFIGSTEGIIIIDGTGKIIIANPAAEKIFYYTSGELAGMQLESLLPTRYRTRHHHHRNQYVIEPSPRQMGVGRDLKALRKDGSEFPIEISLSHAKITGQTFVMAFVIDITLRKKAEIALKNSEEQLIIYATELEKKVESRTEALNSLVKKMEKEIKEREKAEQEVRKLLARERELNDLKSRFVSIASHEFRTPLSTVLSSVSLIDQYKQRGEYDKQEKHIHRIKSSVKHLTAILNDFLSLGKLEEGKLEVVIESFDVDLFIQEVIEELKPTLKSNQRIVLTMPSTRSIQTDARILRNIFFNLLSNASKYSDEGKEINLSISYTQEALTCSIIDQGIGIPQEDIVHLFERFFRAGNAGNIQGTGLGLHIVKRYVELLKGKLTFDSKEKIGSTFTFTIPVEAL